MPDHQPSALFASIGAGAALVAVGLFVGVTVNSAAPDTLPEAAAAPTSASTSASATPTTSASATSTSSATTSTSATKTSAASASEFSADEHGYVDWTARCDDSQTLMAYGRTERSLVAVCVDRDGDLEYRGVRLSDKASLELPVTRGSDGVLIATNDGVTYSISPSMFLVSDGDNVIYRDAWIEYKEPSFSTAASTTSTSSTSTSSTSTSSTATSSNPSSATATSSAGPTVSTTTVTVTTSVTPTPKAGG